MNKRETIFVIVLLVFVAGFTASVPLFSKQKNPERATKAATTATAEHDETNSDGHHNNDNQDIGPVVDLTTQSEVTMDIKDFKYERPNIKIKKGTTVTWTNQDTVKHNVMKEHDDSDAAHDAPTKDEVKPDVFAGQLLAKGESYSFTFNEIGEVPYHCSPHPSMNGSVTVVE